MVVGWELMLLGLVLMIRLAMLVVVTVVMVVVVVRVTVVMVVMIYRSMMTVVWGRKVVRRRRLVRLGRRSRVVGHFGMTRLWTTRERHRLLPRR